MADIKIKGGFLVRLATEITGGVSYQRTPIEVVSDVAGGVLRACESHTEVDHTCRRCREDSASVGAKFPPLDECGCYMCRKARVGPIRYFKKDAKVDPLSPEYKKWVKEIPESMRPPDAKIDRWTTTRTTRNPEEHAAAVKARADARNRVARAVVSTTAFGMWVPLSERPDLDKALNEARAIVDAHNRKAQFHRVSFAWITGYAAPDDAENARGVATAINQAIRDMQAGIAAADPKAIRDAADQARKLSSILADGTSGPVSAAIDEARAAAREIQKRIVKAGEAAESVLSEIKIEALREASSMYLDLESVGSPDAVALPAVSLDLSTVKVNPNPSAAPAAVPVDL